MLDQNLRIIVFFIFTTNGSEGIASGANYSGVRMSSPSRSIALLIESHQKQLKKLTAHLTNSLANHEILSSIGWKCMRSLRGQSSPDPTTFNTTIDNDSLTTLTCTFLTDKGDGEHWTALGTSIRVRTFRPIPIQIRTPLVLFNLNRIT